MALLITQPDEEYSFTKKVYSDNFDMSNSTRFDIGLKRANGDKTP